MTRFRFYLTYAAQNLLRSGHWTTFAVLCVAAGVATVVALRSLGLSITDSLLSNLRDINHGDVTISTVSSGPFSFTFNSGGDERQVFQDWQLQRFADKVAEYGGRMTAYSTYNNVQVTALDFNTLGRPQFTTTIFIDPRTFPPHDPVVTLDPPAATLADLLPGGYEIVISANLAEAQNIAVGDQVRVTGTEQLFTVTGIAPTEAEANLNNILASFFGFVYLHESIAPALQLNPAPNHVSVALPDGTDPSRIEALGYELTTLQVYFRSLHTTPYLLERNQELGDLLGRFIVVLGLGAMLIGGVGIVNTMLVMVGRRTMEIAALKTFGLKGRQIAFIFITEAFMLGILGSILGTVIGLGLSLVVNRFGEALLQQRLVWRFHPEAVWYGVALGLVVTVVFGVLPVIMAARIRPAIVLRPNQTHLPRASWLEVLAAVGVVVLVLGFIAGEIAGPLLVRALGDRAPNATLTGIAGVSVTLLLLLLLTVLLWLLVWLVSRLPSFGIVDLRLALRNLTARRVRTATTLLALSTGMFALSSISFFGLGARQIVQYQFSETLGGNVMVFPLVNNEIGGALVNMLIDMQDEIIYNTRLTGTFANVEQVDGAPIMREGRAYVGFSVPAIVRETNHPYLRSGILLAGRDLQPEDYGQPVVVLSEQSLVESAVREFTLADLGITVGSTVRMRFGREYHNLEVIGIVGSLSGIAPNVGGAFLPPGVLGANRGYNVNILQVTPEKLNDTLVRLSAIPFVLALDITFVDTLLTQLIGQMSAIPTIVGLLSLLAAAVIMANTVSLATLERRHQIGILKALGLKRQRVLRVMLLENSLIGLLGAVLGIALSAVGVSIMTSIGMGIPVPVPGEAIPVALALVIASVLIAWLATFLSARVAVNEKVTQVLRYE